jgi:RNA polymerase sigma factor (TIGR02999 family)
MRDERTGHTLQATALVHEAYVRLLGAEGAGVAWSGLSHFYAAAGEAMRRILVEHARKRGAVVRGGGRAALDLSGVADLATRATEAQIVSLDGAFGRLEQEMPVAAAVVRLRFYAGLSVEQTAKALGMSGRTVIREWTYARAWLVRELSQDSNPGGAPESE